MPFVNAPLKCFSFDAIFSIEPAVAIVVLSFGLQAKMINTVLRIRVIFFISIIVYEQNLSVKYK